MMINEAHLNLLLDILIATGHHVDVLSVLWLLLVQIFEDKKLHSMTEVCLAQEILLGRDILRVGRLWEVLMHDLLSGSLVPTLEAHS